MEKNRSEQRSRLRLFFDAIGYQVNPFATQRRGESKSDNNDISRRDFLKQVASIGAGLTVSRLPEVSPRPTDFSKLKEEFDTLLQYRDIGLEVKRFDASGSLVYEYARKSDELFPVASTFKLFVALYYFLNTEMTNWKFEEGSDMHSMIVYSNNGKTGDVLASVAESVPGDKNAVEKFNDFLHSSLGVSAENGLARWDAGALHAGENHDERIHQVPDSKAVNFLTTEDIVKGLSYVANAETVERWESDPRFKSAIEALRKLASLPTPDYKSVLETVTPFQNGYGKDGILRPSDIGISVFTEGCVYPQLDGGSLVVAYMSKRQTEPTLRVIMRDILWKIEKFEKQKSSIAVS